MKAKNIFKGDKFSVKNVEKSLIFCVLIFLIFMAFASNATAITKDDALNTLIEDVMVPS